MIERRNIDGQRKANTLGAMDAWAGIGPVIRLLVTVAIIAGACWLVLQIAQLIAMLVFVLSH